MKIGRAEVSFDSMVGNNIPEMVELVQTLLDKGLAYKAPGLVNWCPSCQKYPFGSGFGPDMIDGPTP